MTFLVVLWLPILLSAVIVFVASFILHMLLKYHQGDYHQLPDEEKLLSGLRPANLKPGLYMFPYSTHKDMKSPATIEKFKQGPVGFLTIFPSGPPAMGKYMVSWFVYCLLVALFAACVLAHTVPRGALYPQVFRIAGVVTFMSYGLGPLVGSIWKGQPWSMTIKEVVDGLIYSLLTAGTFGWLWPR